ncbi:MAG: head GIN domain-containing protein [Acidobacteriota bacterium]
MLRSMRTVLFLLLASALLFSACKGHFHGKGSIDGSGHLVTQTKSLGSFDGIRIKTMGSVYLTQGEDESVRIEADDNIMDRVIAENHGGTLTVGLKDGSYSDVTLRVYVTTKRLRSIAIDGAGSFECRSPITTPSLDCSVSGAGSIELRGSCDEFECTINGAGNISAKDLAVHSCRAELNGAGHCSITVTEKLDASVSGIGAITYYGNPPVVHSHVSGIGAVSKGS